MSSEDAFAMLKKWQMASTSLESNAISPLGSEESKSVFIKEVFPPKALVADRSGYDTIDFTEASFEGIEPTVGSAPASRVLQARLNDSRLIVFKEKLTLDQWRLD